MNKKEAMFGKLSQLDQCNLKQCKTAAMFGLDARIALAIFGALSVITGAALYSAIQNAKVVSVITELEEIGKSYYSYYLDTGYELPLIDAGNKWDVNGAKLVSSAESNWKGPYVSYKLNGAGVAFEHSKYGIGFLLRATRDDWNDGLTLPNRTCDLVANAGKTCYVWVAFSDIGSADVAKGIDIRIDGSDSPTTGDVRVKGGLVFYLAGISNVNK